MGVVGEWQRLHHIRKPFRQQVGKVVARRPVFQLQDSRATKAIAETGSDALESRPKLPHGTPTQNHAVSTVDEVRGQAAKLCQEGAGVPERGVEAVMAAADDDGDPTTPLAAPQPQRRRSVRVTELQQSTTIEPRVTHW